MKPELAFVFYSSNHHDQLESAIEAIYREIDRAWLIGCTTEAVIAESQEIESGPGFALWVSHLGGAPVEAFTVDLQETPDGHALVGFPLLGAESTGVILLADPLTFPTQALLSALNTGNPQLPIIGGMASGGFGETGHTLVFNDSIKSSGAVGIVVGSPISLRPVVSQGCKPIGDPFVVTAAEHNVILEMGGKPPLVRLREIAMKLPPEDQALMQGVPPMLGIVIDEYTESPAHGDFLVRNVAQVNLETGAMAVGEVIEVGKTVQFHLRDAGAADDELSSLLSANDSVHPEAALMFVCNGRGTGLFGSPNHDIIAVESILGDIPAAGMFCAGEVGPVGGRTFIHGYTASIALFTDQRD